METLFFSSILTLSGCISKISIFSNNNFYSMQKEVWHPDIEHVNKGLRTKLIPVENMFGK